MDMAPLRTWWLLAIERLFDPGFPRPRIALVIQRKRRHDVRRLRRRLIGDRWLLVVSHNSSLLRWAGRRRRPLWNLPLFEALELWNRIARPRGLVVGCRRLRIVVAHGVVPLPFISTTYATIVIAAVMTETVI